MIKTNLYSRDFVKANLKGDKLLNKLREQRDRYGSGANKRRTAAVLLPSIAAEVAQAATDTNIGNVYAFMSPSYKEDATLMDAQLALSKNPFKDAQNQVLYEKNRRGQWINALHGNIFDAVGGKKKRLQKLMDDHVYLDKNGVSKLTKKQYINKLEGQVKDLNRQYKGNAGYLSSSLGVTLNPTGFIGQAIGKRIAKKENAKLSQGNLSDDKYIKYLQNKKDDLYIKEAGSRNALKSSVLLPVLGTLPGYAIGKKVAKGDVKNEIKLHSLTPGVAMTKKKQLKEDEVRKQSRYFNRVTDFALDNAPVLGAIGGAGLGGYLGYQRNKDTTNPYRGAAVGALAGGAAGYGLASIAQVPAVRARSFEIMQNPEIDEVTKQRALVQSRAMDKSPFNIFPAIKRPGLNRL